MSINRKIFFGVLVGLLMSSTFVLAESTLGQSPLPRTGKSPFLGDLSDFKRQKKDPNLFISRPSKKKAADFDAYIIDPVKIYISPNSPLPKLTDENRQMLENMFRSMALTEVGKYHKVVENQGPGVLRVRLAIQDARPGRYYMNKDGTHIIKPDAELAGATFELDTIDSITGERIVALFYQLEKSQVKGADKEQKLKKVEQLFADWVGMLSEEMSLAKIK